MNRQRGSVFVEFLLIFPAFLVVSMFVIETGLMWADRHVARLAAFEAARVFASGNLPEWNNGTAISDPCLAPNLKKKAQQAAIRKIAMIAPPLPLMLTKLGSNIKGLDFGLGSNVTAPAAGSFLTGLAGRIISRWPAAAVLTQVTCHYDAPTHRVKVSLVYNRMLQTPIIDRVIYMLYTFVKSQTSASASVGLDGNYFGVTTAVQGTAGEQSLKDGIDAALATAKAANLSLQQTTAMLADTDGAKQFFEALPSAPAELGVGAKMANAQAQLLATVAAMAPQALWYVPLEQIDLTLERDVYTRRVADQQPLQESSWAGLATGVMHLDGAYRDWARSLTDDHGVAFNDHNQQIGSQP